MPARPKLFCCLQAACGWWLVGLLLGMNEARVENGAQSSRAQRTLVFPWTELLRSATHQTPSSTTTCGRLFHSIAQGRDGVKKQLYHQRQPLTTTFTKTGPLHGTASGYWGARTAAQGKPPQDHRKEAQKLPPRCQEPTIQSTTARSACANQRTNKRTPTKAPIIRTQTKAHTGVQQQHLRS